MNGWLELKIQVMSEQPKKPSRWFVSVACLVAVVWWAPVAVLAENSEPRDPREYFFTPTFGDLPEEMAEAVEGGKQGMLLFFEAEGCPYCLYMLRNVFNQQTVQDWYRKRFVSIAVDIHGDVELKDFDGITLPSKVFSDQRRVFLTPAVSFINPRGEEIYRHTGTIRTPEEFLLLGEYIEEGHYDDIEFRTFAEQRGWVPEAGRSTPAAVTDHSADRRDGLR